MAGNKIDYKDYLKQFGSIETDAKNRIKAYLEEQIENDAALKALYRPEKIDDCYDFIKNAVKATGCGSSATVEDAIVFKMARDYFLDILPKAADEPPEVKSEVMLHQADEEEGESVTEENSEAETEPEAVTENEEEITAEADNENETVRDKYGFEVFGEEPESVTEEKGAETATEAETEAETEPEAVTEIIEEETTAEADNENEGTPCEEAESENEKPKPSATKYDEEGQGLFDFQGGVRRFTNLLIGTTDLKPRTVRLSEL